MELVHVEQLSKSYGRTILDNISFSINSEDKIGLIGQNGKGKSTLLKILVGEETYEGVVDKRKNLRVLYLPQVFGTNNEECTIADLLNSISPSISEIEKKMGQPEYYDNQEKFNELLLNYENLLKAAKLKFNERKFYTILKDLNFQDEDLELRLKDLSCGQMTKVGIAKVLATVSDVLILDEPTNHLDIDAREWLEDYLCDLDKPLLLVSHDRYFLDTIVNKIFEIEDATLTKYNGNYTAYLEAKTKQFELDVARHSQEQKEIARLKESAYIKLVWARRGGSHQLARTGHSMEKRAERLEKVAIAEPKDKTEKMKIKFESERSEKSIYFCENLTKEYEHRVLFNGLNLNIERCDKIALIGPNGHGKTTLLDIITRKVEPTSGISYLNPSVVLGYYDQQQKFDDESRTLLEELQITYPAINEGALRRSLGNVLFRKDDVFKKIACLSNGEKARLLLTKLMLSNPNFLIFDEPTNNLDIVSTDIFLDTLKEYKGTVLLVSHDRYFIDQLCSSTWYLADKHVITFPGNYSKFKHHTMFEQDSKS